MAPTCPGPSPFRSVDSRTGIRARSDRFVTSALFRVGCPSKSEHPRSCSSAWLPAWLPAGPDRLFFRPDISQVARDRASVVRCRWSLLLLSTRRRPSGRKPTRILQGMVRVRSGQLRPALCLLTGVSAEAPGSSVTSRRRSPGTFACARCLAVTVTLEARGRARTLSGPSPDLSPARILPPRIPQNLRIKSQARSVSKASEAVSSSWRMCWIVT